MKDLTELIERVGESVPVPEQHKAMVDSLVEAIHVSNVAFETASVMRRQADKKFHEFIKIIMPELKEWKYEYFFEEYVAKLIIPNDLVE
jgi:hypothetical protein